MITMRVPSDMMDRETIAAISLNTESSTTNDGQPRNDMERLRMIRERTYNEPDRGRLVITTTQLYGEIDTDGIEFHRQTMLTKRFEERQVVGIQEVVNKSITEICIHDKETGIAIIEEENRRQGWTPALVSSTLHGVNMHCTICIVFYAMYSLQCILCNVFYALYSMHCTLPIVFYALFVLFIVLYALYSMVCFVVYAL